jgi:hypothetical protein
MSSRLFCRLIKKIQCHFFNFAFYQLQCCQIPFHEPIVRVLFHEPMNKYKTSDYCREYIMNWWNGTFL